MILRNAKKEDAEICYQCIEDAKCYQQSLGFVQWDASYPTLCTILEDIEQNIGYVFVENEQILGYCCIIFGEDPDYLDIEGAWQTNQSYAVVHRMAFAKNSRGKGFSVNAFSLIKKFCIDNGTEAIRIDTHEANKIMQHILQRENFIYCGVIMFQGTPRFAYEWDYR